jgi:hypothetical protein
VKSLPIKILLVLLLPWVVLEATCRTLVRALRNLHLRNRIRDDLRMWRRIWDELP